MPEVQKRHFPLAVLDGNYNILKMLCQVSLKICILLNVRVLDQNLTIKKEWKLCYFLKCSKIFLNFLKFSENFLNCQKWSTPMEF